MPKQFVANEDQSGFLTSQARFILASGGVGSGKSASGAVKSIMKLRDGDGIIVGPDFPQFSKSTFPEFLKWAPMSRCENAHLDHPYTAKKALIFNVGGERRTIYYGGIDNEDSWAGPSVNWIWFDEGGRKRTRKAFDILAGRARIGPNPQLWITSTPHGMHHWLYDVFVKGVFNKAALDEIRAMGHTGPLVEYFSLRTERNRENLDPFYYQSLMSLYSGNMAKQELEGKFVTMDGMVWDKFSEGVGDNVTIEADYVGGVPVEWWVDDGFAKGHPRVFLMAQVIPPYVNVFDEYIVTYEQAEESIHRALTEKPWPKPSVAYCDSSAAELRDRLWNSDIDTVAATHNVIEGVKRVASWICDAEGKRRLRFHPRCEFSIAELQNYVWDEAKNRPKKELDNVADAVRYGMWFKDREGIVKDGANYKSPILLPKDARQAPQQQVVAQRDILREYAQRWGGL